MLIDFFYTLRTAGLPVSLKEFLTLLEALKQHVAFGSLEAFYFLARTTLIKDEKHYDRFDQVFGHYFEGKTLNLDDLQRDIPEDWLRKQVEKFLSEEEKQQLQAMGWRYGDFEAHDGLWEMCEKTRDDITARMALVPRTLEARGLDATPLIQDKLTRAGDLRAVEILDVILRDEVGHVAIGNRWFHHLCQARGLDAVSLYPQLVKQYEAPRLRPPFNEAARRAAGFTDEELAFLAGDE